MSENLPAVLKANLPTDYATLDQRDFLSATGMGSDDFGLGLPSLRVNYDDQDNDGNSIPRGQWSLYKDGVRHFAKDVSFRVMYATYQYSHYDATEGKTLSQSIHFSRFGEEVYDSTGGV